MTDEWITMEEFLKMNINETAMDIGVMDYDRGLYTFTPIELKTFFDAIVDQCIKVIKPTSYHEAYPDNMLGSYDGLKLLQLRVDDLERLKR